MIETIVYPVKDLARARTLYRTLSGAEPYVDEPYYVGFRFGNLEVGLDPGGHAQGAVCYWRVDDIEATLAQLVAGGAEVQQPAADVGGGKLIATVKDADGNVLGLAQSP